MKNLSVRSAGLGACGVFAALVLAAACGRGASPLPNILLIETDDQRADTLWAMPRVRRELAEQGVTFSLAVVSNPVCCPSRASLLAGGYYSHHVGVLTLGPPDGGAARFADGDSLAVRLKRQGYRTGLVGKYLNGYDEIAPRIPPGWDRFVTRIGPPHFFHHRLVIGEAGADGPSQGRIEEREQYLTYLERDEALRFLAESRVEEQPFFLFLSTHAPHRPASPAPEDAAAFADFAYRERAYGEEDVSDKPASIVRMGAGFVASEGGQRPTPGQPGFPPNFPRTQLRALRAVDRALGEIFDRLKSLPTTRPTVVFLTSDNGMLWGEHRLYRKGLPYEEAIRVPLLVRLPGIPAGERRHLVAIDLDVAPTILELAGLPTTGDGKSLLPILRDAAAPWRKEVLLQGYGLAGVPPWAAIRSERFKYVEYADGGRELYDLERDPFELQSRHGAPELEATRTELRAAVEAVRGLAFDAGALPIAVVGEPYRARLSATGGEPPYRWSIASGSLPPGLALAGDGEISGTPEKAEERSCLVAVSDSSASPRDGRAQTFHRLLRIPFSPAAAGVAAGAEEGEEP